MRTVPVAAGEVEVGDRLLFDLPDGPREVAVTWKGYGRPMEESPGERWLILWLTSGHCVRGGEFQTVHLIEGGS